MASIHETLGAGRRGHATLIAADPPRRGVFRRIVLPTLLAAVLLGFAAIVWLAWRDAYPGDGEPPLIRAAPGPIKRPPDTPGGVDFEGERHGIASVLNGPPPAPRVERLLPREPAPPRTLAEADPALVAPPPVPRPEPPPAASGATSPAPASPAPALPGSGAAAADGPLRPTAASAPPATGEPRPASEPGRASTALAAPPAVAADRGADPMPPAPAPATSPAARSPEPAAGRPATEPVRPMPRPAGTGEPTPTTAAPTTPPPPATAARTTVARAGAGAVDGPAAAVPPAPPSATARPPAPAPAPPPERLAAREPPGREPGTSSAPAAAGAGPWGVQIAAVSSREAAERGWSQLQSRHPEVLGALRLRVEEARLASGLTLYRLQGLGFPDRESAAQACARLKAAGIECFVVGGR